MGSWEKLLGKGSYGYVHKMIDNNNESCAVKITYIEDTMDFGGSYREIDMLTRLKHPFIISLKDVVYKAPLDLPPKYNNVREDNTEKQDSVYMIFESGDYDLEDGSLSTFSESHKSIVQILLALEYIHKFNHIHRDVKPANLVYFEKTETCKLIDFGMCKPIFKNCRSNGRAITGVVRPPELFCGNRDDYMVYGCETDVWSLGITWLYLFLKKEISTDKDDTNEEAIKNIYELIPCDELSDEDFYNQHPYINERPTWKSLLDDFYQESLVRILKGMLNMNPKNRWSCTQVLNDHYFDEFRELIEVTRNQTNSYIPNCLKSYTYHPSLSPEREIMLKECKPNKFITYRILFHAIEIIDRYLEWRSENNIPRPHFQTSIYRARIIIYLCYKYFSIMVRCHTFETIFDTVNLTNALRKEMLEWEKILVRDVLKFQIYRVTPFEMAKDNKKLIQKYYQRYIKPESSEGWIILGCDELAL